jgi:L-asparaginase
MGRIKIIHTGGTIGMVRSGDGFRPSVGVVEDEVERQIAQMVAPPKVEILRLDPLIDSADATPEDWNRITAGIASAEAGTDGVVVVHGTDTLAFAAAALSFALEGLDKPVILTGAMLPVGEPGSDGPDNLAHALEAAGTAPPGVWVAFAGRLLHGGRLRKTHSHAMDAFAATPARAPPLRPGNGFTRHAYGARNVAVLPFAPGVSMSVLHHAAEICDGLVLRCYGSGTAPNTSATEAALARAADRDIPVLAVSQCAEGGIARGTYAADAILTRNGVVDGRDMTMEAAYVKMQLALSATQGAAEARAFLGTPLCGEMADPPA